MEMLVKEKRLGIENARKVLKAFANDAEHFGFIRITEDELADLASLYRPFQMVQRRRDLFSFCAGTWMVVIVVQDGYVEVSLINPYDVNEYIHTFDI